MSKPDVRDELEKELDSMAAQELEAPSREPAPEQGGLLRVVGGFLVAWRFRRRSAAHP